MARSVILAGVLLAMLAGAHAQAAAPKAAPKAAPAASPAAAADTGSDFGTLSEVPTDVTGFDINAITPLLPLLSKIPAPLLAEIGKLTPKINVTWVEILLPYVGKADPAEVGKIIQALLPALKDLDTAIVARLIEVAAKINPKIIVAIAPYLSKLDVNVLKRLIPSIAALNPDLLVNTLNLVAGLTPEAWEALLHIVELGVPAINLVGWKLNLLPVSVGAPAPFSQARGSVFQLPSFLG